jgi:hypothetical protein
MERITALSFLKKEFTTSSYRFSSHMGGRDGMMALQVKLIQRDSGPVLAEAPPNGMERRKRLPKI